VQVPTAPVIVWLRVGNTTNRALWAWVEPRLPGISGLLAHGSRLVEVV
jgi:predicted nuclease of predicted toxin-antitoxin system